MKPIFYADISELVKDLSDISDKSPEEITKNILTEFGEKIVSNARGFAPAKTGKLRDSISYRVERNTLSVGPHVPYGTYQEFGTASRGEFGGEPYVILPKKGKYLTFKVDGKWVSTRQVVHPGIKAHPYMRPAVMKTLGGLADALAEKGQMMIVKGPNYAE
jgi:HK97 gp10 family phage protein